MAELNSNLTGSFLAGGLRFNRKASFDSDVVSPTGTIGGTIGTNGRVKDTRHKISGLIKSLGDQRSTLSGTVELIQPPKQKPEG